MKIIFVGIHNKPNKEPLDITTRSGKVITRVCNKLPKGVRVLRTNLADLEFIPERQELINQRVEWLFRACPDPEDIIVLLGMWVKDNFPYDDVHSTIIKANHPAAHRNKDKQQQYETDLAKAIKEALSK